MCVYICITYIRKNVIQMNDIFCVRIYIYIYIYIYIACMCIYVYTHKYTKYAYHIYMLYIHAIKMFIINVSMINVWRCIHLYIFFVFVPKKHKDPCSPNPCVHGSCTINGGSHQCNCKTGFSGKQCQYHKYGKYVYVI